MPMPRVADNPIFQPGSGFFSWQKVIEANKDRSKQVGEEFNKALEQKAQAATTSGETAKRTLEAQKADIDRTKQNVADYVSGKMASYKPEEQAQAKQSIKEAAQKGYSFAAEPAQKSLAEIARTQADLNAARSVSGRLGLQSGKLPTQAALFDQVALLQGGAGSNVDELTNRLSKTSALLGQELGDVGLSAAGLQRDIVNPLTEFAKKQIEPAKNAAIEKGREVAGQRIAQSKQDIEKQFGDPAAYKQYGIDINQFIKAPNLGDLTEAELMAYGAPSSNEYQTLQETYNLLGLSQDVLGEQKALNATADVEAAKEALRQKQIAPQVQEEIKQAIADQSITAAPRMPGVRNPVALGPIQGESNWQGKTKEEINAELEAKKRSPLAGMKFNNLLTEF